MGLDDGAGDREAETGVFAELFAGGPQRMEALEDSFARGFVNAGSIILTGVVDPPFAAPYSDFDGRAFR